MKRVLEDLTEEGLKGLSPVAVACPGTWQGGQVIALEQEESNCCMLRPGRHGCGIG